MISLPRWSAVGLCIALTMLAFLISSSPAYSDAVDTPPGARYRFGVGVTGENIDQYDVGRIRAGWYVDWGAKEDPPRPAGMEYVQMVRLHQLTECWPERTPDRDACPYVVLPNGSYTYTLTSPNNRDEVVSIAQAKPGSLWLIGNEMDRRDWEGGGQDEMLPELYAEAYHELYHLIKDADPTAQVAIGGVIQPTPLRLDYLDIVWNTYEALYGEQMPVDVWNIHNMILREASCDVYYPWECFGAEIPPGIDADVGEWRSIQDADKMALFKEQIRDFRQWMKGKGEREKPLIISEYSVLYGEDYLFDYARVKKFLYATFDYMTTETDSELGYPEDDNKLVQRWAWYSLNDDAFGNDPSHHHLFDPDTKRITQLGIDYGDYVSDLCHSTDIDCDGDVDVADAQTVAGRWRCASDEQCYYPWYDVDQDDGVSIVDIMKVAADWGWDGSP